MNCLNCHTEVTSNFCPNCGQKTSTQRITFRSFSQNLASDVIDTDKGILFNLKNLTLNPGKSVNNYIDGKRKNIFNPISYAIIAITVYLIVSKYFGVNTSLKESDFGALTNEESYKFGKDVGMFLAKYVKYFFLLHIVYISLMENLFFSKKNLYELMTINGFIVGHSVVIGILFYPIFRNPIVFDPVIICAILVLSFLVFKKTRSKSDSVLIPFFSLIASYLLMFLLPLLIFYLISLTK